MVELQFAPQLQLSAKCHLFISVEGRILSSLQVLIAARVARSATLSAQGYRL